MLLDKIEIPENIDTPYVSLDPETGKCEITGKSYPEDITAFYMHIVDWFEEYVYSGEKDLTLDMKLTYFNSASQKIYTEIFEKLMDRKKFNVLINWYYAEDDDEILENGKIYQNLTELDFNFIPY
jgi:hypothetical protein